jgi:hypothetical protein
MYLIKDEKAIYTMGYVIRRLELHDGTIVWLDAKGSPYSPTNSKNWEEEYKKLINKPVETTNEQPKLTEQEYNVLMTCMNKNFDLHIDTINKIRKKLDRLKV